MTDEPLTTSAITPSNPAPGAFAIVGVGASAGGLESFRRLLSALPQATGMAYVFIQHLDPKHESILTALLAQITEMPVAEVNGDVLVEPNHVYVISPSRDLVLVDGTLRLIDRAFTGSTHLPIDGFLCTLAKVQGSRAIGVVLSGMGSDGTLGLRAIEAEGGTTFVQDPRSAKHDEMPRSAIAASHVDFVLSPEEIAHELVLMGERFRRDSSPVPVDEDEASLGSEIDVNPDDAAGLAAILDGLRKASGTDFNAYKKTTLRRRIERRMVSAHIDGLAQYARHLDENPAERTALYEDCLISVTSFFRDPEVFEALAARIVPLLSARAPEAPFRIWVAGCATGEEAYSIAMCLLESNGELLRTRSLQIFATDLSDRALARAREGAYPMTIAAQVTAERLRRFFVKTGDHYQISKTVREMCVFARHDLTRDPPYSRLDLISCRNVLIYLGPPLQEMVLATFHYALRPEGLLLVGPAETATGMSGLFAAIDEPHRLFCRKPGTGPPRLLSARHETSPSWTAFDQPSRKLARSSEVPREADRIILARFGPAAVVVDESLNVLEFRGDTDPFLDHGHGKATLSLERLLRKGLLIELREAIAEVRASSVAVRRAGLRVRNRHQLQTVSVEVIPIEGRAAADRCLLILFEIERPAAPSESKSGPAPVSGDKEREIERLSEGLARATDYTHTLMREHETALAELQSTTEEALSSNEELQSLNEELQTAKEEIQSTNEELATLNQELQDRNSQLARSNGEIQRGLNSANALVDTVPLPLVILDPELRVEAANAAFYSAFRVSAARTKGRLLAELGNRQWDHPELLVALSELFTMGTAVEDLAIETEFPDIGVRTMTLNARRVHFERSDRERALLAIDDRTEITRARRGREALLELERGARVSAEAADHLKDQFVATVSHELRGPLSVISGWADVLSLDIKNKDEPALSRGLAAIRRGVAAQRRLISELLDHSQIVMGKLVLQRHAIDLVPIAETVLVGVRAAAQAKDIALSFSHERATCIVLGDLERMQQLLWNLVLNAIKFTPPKGSVAISIGRVTNQVQITVTDTGVGISPEFLPHVFERFRQAEGSSSRAQPGLGLGLKLVNELVELHGGTVQAHSLGIGYGSTFVVTLPIPALLQSAEELNAEDEGVKSTSSEPPESLLTGVSSDLLAAIRILVVDDDADAQGAICSLLERYGAHVRSVSSVGSALQALETEVPDVMISDLGMPGEDGYDLIRRVRLLPPTKGGLVPTMAVSAYATDSHRRSAVKAGFQKYLEKPVDPSRLIRDVARLADRAPGLLAADDPSSSPSNG